MYCEKCGYKLRRGVKSCAQCGAQTPYNHSRSAVLIILAVLLTIAGIVAVVILDKEQAIPVLIVDLVTVAAVLIGLFVGVKRGFLYGTLSTVLLAVVFAVSIFASQALTPVIYDGIISNIVTDSIDDAVAESSPSEELVSAVKSAVGDDATEILIGYFTEVLGLTDELTGSDNNETWENYCTALGISTSDTSVSYIVYNYLFAEEKDDSVLTGYAEILAENWLKKCLANYENFDKLCNELTSILNTSVDSYIASQIRENVETKIIEMTIGNNIFTPDSIMSCIELVVDEETINSALDSAIWDYIKKGEPVYDNDGKVKVMELSLSKTIEQELFQPLIVYCLEIVLFLIFVLVLRFLMSLIMKIFRFLEGIHVPYVLDLVFGTVEGIVSGAVWLCYAAVAVGIVIIGILLFGGNDIVTIIEDTIGNTAVFRYFYQLAGYFGI
ncbi:MAG: zinc ribbon domain-containing protein [Oscillospiraceae bacterium]|nr:zinc ribbon domain-containing protein [Oscillospiraceae bacterium]